MQSMSRNRICLRMRLRFPQQWAQWPSILARIVLIGKQLDTCTMWIMRNSRRSIYSIREPCWSPRAWRRQIFAPSFRMDMAFAVTWSHSRNWRESLFTVDELTGIVHAASLMRPTGISDLEVKSLKKKFKDKKFAAKCDRAVITQGCEMLGMELDAVMELVILGMRREMDALGIGPRE